MRLVTVAAIVIIAAMSGAGATIAAQKSVLHSTVFDWTTDGAKAQAWGAVRQVMREKTPTLDELEIHVSTLNPGQTPHEPHRHEHEELLIVKEGSLETFQSGQTRRVGPGGIIFQASNELHNVRNIGSTPATYYVIGWTVPASAK